MGQDGRSMEMTGKHNPGFTLIELLVVVTIIVILVALLTPALDAAIYRADMAVCAANMRTTASAALGYAFDHHRDYPKADQAWPYHLSNPLVDLIDPYLALNRAVNCPMAHAVDYERSSAQGSAGGMIPTTAFWFSWKYTGLASMTRLGTEMTALDHADTTAPIALRFRILASDWDLYYRMGDNRGSHPDDAGVMNNEYTQDEPEPANGNPVSIATNLAAPAPRTYSWWWGRTAVKRGHIDMNFAYDDGSAVSLWRVPPRDADERMSFVSPLTDPATSDPVLPLPRGH